MRGEDALVLALQLMNEHDLTRRGWRFGWLNSVRTMGQCQYTLGGGGFIKLSRKLVAVAPESEVRDTILHEIAHALVGPGHHHNHIWRRQALAIGCNGQRCHNVKLEAPWNATCGKCGTVHSRHRLTFKVRQFAHCGKCRMSPETKLTWSRS